MKQIMIDCTNIDIKQLKDVEQILHQESYAKVIDLLREDLHSDIDNILEGEEFYRTHNAIFIEGGRGSGKTQFLLNLKRLQSTNYKEDRELRKLYFIGPIDPTILHDNESFLTIVLAKILNQIEGDLKYLKEHQKKSFYELLKSISFAIDGVINKKNSQKTALEHIAQDQSSLKLELYLHHFFREVSSIVGEKRLVLLIDDIDMAFDKGFEILEVIRKYLSSPYLVPIVTGDKWLYEDILEKHFFSELKNDYFMGKYYEHEKYPNRSYKRDTIKELQKDYLIKVLPSHRRVKLKTLFELAENRCLVFIFGKKKFLFERHIEEFFHKCAKNIYVSDKGANEFIEGFFSNSLRKITQLLHGEYSSSHDVQFNLKDRDSLTYLTKKYSLQNIPLYEEYEILYDKGEELLNKGLFTPALKYFKESLNIKESEKTFQSIANCQFSLMEYKKAIETYQKLIEIDDKNPHVYYKIAYSYAQLNQYEKAIEYYKQVLELLPNSEKTHNSLGLSYMAKNEIEEAFSYYKKALELKEDYYKPYINIFEIALISEEFARKYRAEIKKLKTQFLANFEKESMVMKALSIIELLKKIFFSNEPHSVLEQEVNEWIETYKDINLEVWDFTAIEKWIASIKDTTKQKILRGSLIKIKENI